VLSLAYKRLPRLKPRTRAWLAGAILLAAGACHAFADPAPFDLNGPRIDVRVTREGKTLPIAQVANLQPGDKVWVYADLPATQSAHYLMVVAFLRGATNPPPHDWFIKQETWQKKSGEGIRFTVPAGAQQMMIFLAPETGGDFKTLRNAVRGRPGSFVRASQDLNQASLDRSRVQTYLEAVRETSEVDPSALESTSKLLTRSLNLKAKEDCFSRPLSEQEQCLTQNSESMVLNDGYQSMVSALTTGAGSDLATQLSYAPTAGSGYYSAYVGSVIDLARLLEGLRTAQYQYIPALTVAKDESLQLKLNNPPSFHNPKSVLVVAMPAVQTAQMPPMQAINPKQVSCLSGPDVVLPVQGAPLIYSTSLAHNLALHVEGKSGKSIDLPVRANAAKGGLVVDASAVPQAHLDPFVVGKIVGLWGFDRLDGPSFNLAVPHPTTWQLDKGDSDSLVVGRDDVVRLRGNGAPCVAEIQLRDSTGKEIKANFKVVKPDELEVTVPMTHAATGPAGLLVRQTGLQTPDQFAIRAYAQAGHLDAFEFHAGDQPAVLVGTRLDEVASVDLKGVHFVPGELSSSGDKDRLTLKAVDPKAAEALPANLHGTAEVTLKDGRTLELENTVSGHRPQITLASTSVIATPDPASLVHLADASELPVNSRISFVLKTAGPAGFSRRDKVQIETDDESLQTTLEVSDGSLVLQDSTTLLGTLDPLKRFGPSAFGKLQLRLIDGSGAPSDWLPFGTLVRVPVIASIKCAHSPRVAARLAVREDAAIQNSSGQQPPESALIPTNDPNAECVLSGSSLFLIDSIASDAKFTNSTSVPDGYMNPVLAVPKPTGSELYLHLRDDPSVTNTITVPPGALAALRAVAHPHPEAPAAPGEDKSAPPPLTGAGATPSEPPQPNAGSSAPASPGPAGGATAAPPTQAGTAQPTTRTPSAATPSKSTPPKSSSGSPQTPPQTGTPQQTTPH